jgi:ParB family chromosome partitioning protein
MAKRRKLEVPSAEELAGIEAELARPGTGAAMAPIAQIAGATARRLNPASTPDGQDAMLWRQAEAEGRVIRNLPIERIHVEHITRDRTALDPEAMDELVASVRVSGVRTPIEVTPLGDGTYGLISGFRRVAAVRELAAEGMAAVVPAVVRDVTDLGESYTRMVEENEIRSQITPYERGRIAVIAAGQGAFTDTTAAVNAIFASASKAKRSKIRSFAALHEELGDLLRHAQDLPERSGLRVAAALREGFAAKLRETLEREELPDARAEWAALEPIVREAETGGRVVDRGGRPKSFDVERLALGQGAELVMRGRSDGLHLRLAGGDEALEEELAEAIRAWAARRRARFGGAGA